MDGVILTRLGEYIARKNRRGLAVGQCYVLEDVIEFAYKEEKFSFPSEQVIAKCRPDGTFYLIAVKTLRKIKKKE